MADETATPTETAPASRDVDFAEAALASMTGQKPAPKVEKTEAAKVEAKEERKTSIPDEVLGRKKEEDKEPESELAKLAQPDFKDPKRKAQWDELHGKASAFEKELRAERAAKAELEKRIVEVEARGGDADKLKERLATLEKQNEEYLKLVRLTNVENDPEFRARHIEGRAQKVKEVEQIITDAGGEAADVAAALALKGKPRVEALRAISDDLPGYLQGLLGQAVRELDTLDREADAKRADAGKYLETREAENRQREREKTEASVKMSELGWERAERKAKAELSVFNKVEGNEEWNAKVDKLAVEARRDFDSSQEPEARAGLIMRAHAAEVFRARLAEEMDYSSALEKERDEARAELKKLYAGTPNLTGKGGANGETSVKEMDFASRAMHEMPTG